MCVTPGIAKHSKENSTKKVELFRAQKPAIGSALLHCNIKYATEFPLQWAQNVYVTIWNPTAINLYSQLLKLFQWNLHQGLATCYI